MKDLHLYLDDTDVNIQGVNRPVRAKARGQRLGRRSVTCNWALDYEDDASSPFASLFSSTTNNADDPRTAARFFFCCLYAPDTAVGNEHCNSHPYCQCAVPN